jgi:hypothetical protein
LTAQPASEPRIVIVSCARSSSVSRPAAETISGTSARSRINARDTLTDSTAILRRCRRCSINAIAGSCAAWPMNGIAASVPITKGPASSASANPTRITPP